MRVGQGFDVHALVAGRKLVIGGVSIPHDKGLEGHSDADVLLHAVCDAMLGAAGLGLFFGGLAAEKSTDMMSLAGLVGIVWSGFLIALAYFFAYRRWVVPPPDAGLWVRMKWRIGVGIAWSVVAVLGILAVMLVLFSFRVLGLASKI